MIHDPTRKSNQHSDSILLDHYLSLESGWADPLPVHAMSVPDISTHSLPPRLRSWIDATAEATQTPRELATLLSLAACAGMVHRAIEISPHDGWSEPLNLYTAVLLDPANRKSSVFGAAFAPVKELEAELIERQRTSVAAEMSSRRILELALKSAENKAKSLDSAAVSEARELARQLAETPVVSMPVLLLDDTTPEAVESELACQHGRLIVAGTEGGVFDVMAGRYSSGSANLDVFLKGHAGDDLRVRRMSRDVTVDRICLTMAYAVQPEVVRGLAGKPQFRGRGLLGRFMYAVPRSLIGRRKVKSDPVPETVAADYRSLIRDLASLATDCLGKPTVLHLSETADSLFCEWEEEIESMLSDGGLLSSFRDWGGKLAGLTARLAGVIHLAGWDGNQATDPRYQPVAIETVIAAIEIARWAIPHAQAAIGLLGGSDGTIADAEELLDWLRDEQAVRISVRDICQWRRPKYADDKPRLDRVLNYLADRGWLRESEYRSGSRGGRPSLQYDCHPSLAD